MERTQVSTGRISLSQRGKGSRAAPLASPFYPRPRVRDLLRRALGRRLVLLIAPTGYGKTTALRDAMVDFEGPVVWHAPQEESRPLQAIASLVIHETQGDKGIPDKAATGATTPSRAAEVILGAVRGAQLQRIHLVFDAIERSAHYRDLCALISALIEGSSDAIKIAVTSTVMPEVKSELLARCRELAIIGPDRLLFTVEDLRGLVADAWGAPPDLGFAEAIQTLTEGWPSGVGALFAAFPSRPESVETLARSPVRQACNPIASELLDHVNPLDRELLLSLAFLPGVDPGDGDALVGVKGVHGRLEILAHNVSGLTPVGGDRYVMSTHLRDRLTILARTEWDADRIAEHMATIGRLLERRGDYERSLHAYVEAGEGEGATRMLRYSGLDRLLQEDPCAFVTLADGLAACHRLGLEAHLILAQLALVRGDSHAWALRCAGISECDTASVPSTRPRETSGRDQLDERSRRAINVLTRVLPTGSIVPLAWEAWLFQGDGFFEEAELRAKSALATAQEDPSAFPRVWASITLARIHCRRGAYAAARAAVGRPQGSGEPETTFTALLRYQTWAELAALEGDLDAACSLGLKAIELADSLGAQGSRLELLPLLVRIAVWQGNLEEARRWVAQSEHEGCTATDVAESRAWVAWVSGVESEAVRVLSSGSTGTPLSLGPWTSLLRAYLSAIEDTSTQGLSELASVRSEAVSHGWAHVGTNAMLCHSFFAFQRGDELAARELLREFWESVAVQGFRFMPVSNPELLLWAGRIAASWWPRWRLPVERLMAPAGVPEIRAVTVGQTEALLVIDTLGPLELTTAGEPRSGEWKANRKAKRFFQLLLSRHGLRISADEAADVLWTEADPEKITHRLHNEVSNLRKVFSRLGIQGHLELRREHGFYRLYCSDQVRITHLEFEKLVERGLDSMNADQHEEAVSALRDAVSLYRGQLLGDARYEAFADAPRAHLAELMTRALHTLAESPAVSTEEALSWWQRAIDHDPCDEEAYHGLIELCVRTDRPRLARHYLDMMKERVVRDLAVPMPDWAVQVEAALAQE